MLLISRTPMNRRYSYPRYWTGTSLQPRLMRGVFSNANEPPLQASSTSEDEG